MYVCKNGNKILNDIPIWESGKNKGGVNYKLMEGMTLNLECHGCIYYNVKILKYISGRYRFIIEYNGYILEGGILCSSFLKGKFSNVLGLINHKHKYEINNVVNNLKITKQDYYYDKYNHKIKTYKVKCLRCNFDCKNHYKDGELIHEYWIREGNLNQGYGCPCCAGKIVVQGINDMYTTDYWMVELGVDEEESKKYTSQSSNNILVKCPHCGENKYIKCNNLYNRKSISCTCGDGFSYPEKFMYNILKQIGAEFETQYSPKYLNLNGSQKKSDFYIPSSHLVIETDGRIGHDGGIVHPNSNKTLEDLEEIDKWKDEQHLKKGVKTIRVNCFKSDMEYIRNNILQSELVNYFDFDNIDWCKANEFAWFSNLRKEVCEYWNSKKEWETVTDLMQVFDISRKTIIDYLNKGNKLGWCNYNSKEEMKKSSLRNNKSRCKSVEIFKDGVSLGVFESQADLSRQSEVKLGVKLLMDGISSARKRNKIYNGFTFK